MDDLIQQECLVESQIETYKSQLSLVEGQLESGGGADSSDLQQLKSDLSELISLTEDSLLEIKKQKLLLILQGSTASPPPLSSSTSSSTTLSRALPSQSEMVCGSESTHQLGGEVESKEEGEEDLQGTRCQAPLKEAWGAVNYHNAVVISREPGNPTDHNEEASKVMVLFTHPTYNAMKPCPFFLEGKCRFDKQSCKFSHGHVVSFSELRPFQDPDFSLVHVGGKCLAKYTDGLWHPAIISTIGEMFTVHFSTLNATAQLELDCVLPLESSDESESSESDSSSGGEEEEEGKVLEWRPTGAQQALGEWEKHTTGIGSRLLAKMGYVVGKGLGKNDQGQVDPLEIVILPAGKSLDVCAEMREAKKLRKPLGEVTTKRRRKRKRNLETGLQQLQQGQQSEESDIFNFLNTKIFKKDHRAGDEFPLGKESGKPSGASKRGRENLNVKLFKLHEEMKSVKKKMETLQKSLLRHKGSGYCRDKNMEDRIQEKLTACQRYLQQLQKDENMTQKSITSKSERKKLAVF